MTAADFLREAATLLRERARLTFPGPWIAVEGHVIDDIGGHVLCDPIAHLDTLSYVATMSPAVALAVADWLDGTYDSVEDALTVAAAVLGREWTA